VVVRLCVDARYVLLVLVGILVLYIIAAEMAKKLFYRKQKL
jgi:hypothetical protein